MPIISCPTCGTRLEVTADSLGQQVQCGECQQIFEAREDRGSGRSRGSKFDRDELADDDRPSRHRGRKRDEEDDADERPSRRRSRRRERDDEDDYDYAPRSREGSGGGSGMGVASLVTGIIALPMGFCCWPIGGVCAILAIIFGVVSLGTPGRGLGIGGIITGVLAILLAVAVLALGFGFNMLNRGGFGPGNPNPPGAFKLR